LITDSPNSPLEIPPPALTGTRGSPGRWLRGGQFRIRHPALFFVAKRVLAGLATLFVVSLIIFTATNILPGNAAVITLGRFGSSPARLHAVEAQLGLTRPLISRYATWLGGALHLNFGQSDVALALHQANTAVSSTLVSPLLNTAILAGLTAIALIPLTLILGVLAGIFAGRNLDYAISAPSLVFGGLPEFVTGTLLVFVFFTRLNLLPPVSIYNPGQSPFSNPEALILPVCTLLAVTVGSGVRQVRSGMMFSLQQDYVQFARLNGVSERRVLTRYAMRNALATSIQTVAQNLQYLLGGIVIVESLFDYPGIGIYLVTAMQERDTNKIEAAALILAAVYVAINILADLAVVYLVPRLRTAI
jgi:peptide/nickel transport system permease protein